MIFHTKTISTQKELLWLGQKYQNTSPFVQKIFKLITHATHASIIAINSTGKITFWNKASETIFGYTNEEALNKDVHTFLAGPNSIKKAITKLPTFLATCEGYAIGKTLALSGIKKNQEVIPIELSLSALKIDNEWHAIGIITDQRKQQKIIQNLKTAKKEAELASKIKSNFVSNISHEIRNPLSAIIGFAELNAGKILINDFEELISLITTLKKQCSSPANMLINFSSIIRNLHLLKTKTDQLYNRYKGKVKNTKHIIKQSEYLLNLVNQILDYSKIQAGKMILEKTPLNLKEMIETIIEPYKFILLNQKTGIQITYSYNPNLSEYIMGDPTRIRQIITNLLSNAIKYTQEGQINISVWIKNKKLTIAVSDTGIGIAKEKQASILEAFQQADVSDTRKYGGTGLGLTITKQLIKLMEGTLEIFSKGIGYGSTFSVLLPYTPCDLQLLETQAIKTKIKSLKNKTREISVLLVDDDPMNKIILSEHIKTSGLKVSIHEVNDGIEAWNALEMGLKPDLVITDFRMPNLTGPQLTKKMKNNPQTRSIPVVGLTAAADLEDKKTFLEAGAGEYLVKPINKQTTLGILVKHLPSLIIADDDIPESDHNKTTIGPKKI